MNYFGMILSTVAAVAAIIVGFLFPAWFMDAVRLTDAEKAQEARGKACAGFGYLVIFFILLINSV